MLTTGTKYDTIRPWKGARPQEERKVRKMWYVAYGCDVYKVTNNGNTYTLYRRFKTERGAADWVARH